MGTKIEAAKTAAPTRQHPSAPHSELFHKTLGPGVGMVDRFRDAHRAKTGHAILAVRPCRFGSAVEMRQVGSLTEEMERVCSSALRPKRVCSCGLTIWPMLLVPRWFLPAAAAPFPNRSDALTFETDVATPRRPSASRYAQLRCLWSRPSERRPRSHAGTSLGAFR
jgi:hypothetical protein